MLAAGVGAAQAAGWAWRRWRGTCLPVRVAAGLGAAWIATSATQAALSPAGLPWRDGLAVTEGFAMVNADPASCGVALEPWSLWPNAGGYVHLRPGLDLHGIPPRAAAAGYAAANYLFRHPAVPGEPAGYTKLQCWPAVQRSLAYCLWHRPGICSAVPALRLAERRLTPVPSVSGAR
jgi:phosphatidylinositol glycan class B